MIDDFNRIVDRRHTDSIKWRAYGDDVLPLWVADMDFCSPPPVLRALHERVDHGVFGYGDEPPELRDVILGWLAESYGWRVAPEALVFMPGVAAGFNLACHALACPGESALIQTPVYPPFLSAPGNARLARDEMELARRADGSYTIDFDAFEAAITPCTRLFILCSPHNPVGRVWQPWELERMAEICLRHGVAICSDEIHCDLVYPGSRHVPTASLSPEIAARTVTLMAPTKTFNLAGIKFSFAVIENRALREQVCAARAGLVGGYGVFGNVAALAAYRHGRPWLNALLRYLQGNRDYLLEYVRSCLPGISAGPIEGTYLAWLDCRQAGLPGNPQQFFLEQARVGLNDGAAFGRGGEGFCRLNFGCPRATLAEALDRMRIALEAARA